MNIKVLCTHAFKNQAFIVVYCIMLLRLFILFAGDILEIGAQWSIAKKDIDSFERYMAQLKCYYLDYK